MSIHLVHTTRSDAFALLDDFDNDADLILTDPPYTISKETGFKNVVTGIKRFAVSMDFGEWDKEPIDLYELAEYSYRALKDHGTVIIFYDLWKITKLHRALTAAGFVQLRLIVWEKTNPVPLNSKRNYLTNSREIAVLGVKKGKPTFNSEYDSGLYRYPIARGGFHPTQKPVDLMQALIEKHSNPGDLVVDPFMGGGSTLVAAMRCGRNCIGGDISNEYVEIANERLGKENRAKAQMTMDIKD